MMLFLKIIAIMKQEEDRMNRNITQIRSPLKPARTVTTRGYTRKTHFRSIMAHPIEGQDSLQMKKFTQLI